jgi:hypothetical protein
VDVQAIRSYVRNHLEVDDEELPDSLLNVYLQDAFERTVALDNRWPRNEAVWSLSKVAGTMNVTMPPDMLGSSIVSVLTHGGNRRLAYHSHENMEQSFTDNYLVTTGDPASFSIWGREICLWPNPGLDVTYDLQVRGYRQPVWSDAAGTIPDIDPRLHPALAYYAMALAYAAQEDEILEGVYMTATPSRSAWRSPIRHATAPSSSMAARSSSVALRTSSCRRGIREPRQEAVVAQHRLPRRVDPAVACRGRVRLAGVGDVRQPHLDGCAGDVGGRRDRRSRCRGGG